MTGVGALLGGVGAWLLAGVALAQPSAEEAAALLNEAEDHEAIALARNTGPEASARWTRCAEVAVRSAAVRTSKMALWRAARCANRAGDILTTWSAFLALETVYGDFDGWTQLRARSYTAEEIAEVRAAHDNIRDHVGGVRVTVAPADARVRVIAPAAVTVGGVIYSSLPATLTLEVEAPGFAPRRESIPVGPLRAGVTDFEVSFEPMLAAEPDPEPGEPADPARLESARRSYRAARQALLLGRWNDCSEAARASIDAIPTRQGYWAALLCALGARDDVRAYILLRDLQQRFGDPREWSAMFPGTAQERAAVDAAAAALSHRVGEVLLVDVPTSATITFGDARVVRRGDMLFGPVGSTIQATLVAPGTAPLTAAVTFRAAADTPIPALLRYPARVATSSRGPAIDQGEPPRLDQDNGQTGGAWPFVLGVRLGLVVSPHAYAPELATAGLGASAWVEPGLTRGFGLSAFGELAYLGQSDRDDGLGPPDESGMPTDSVDEPNLDMVLGMVGLRARSDPTAAGIVFQGELAGGAMAVFGYGQHGGITLLAGAGVTWVFDARRASGFGAAVRYLVATSGMEMVTVDLTLAWDTRSMTP